MNPAKLNLPISPIVAFYRNDTIKPIFIKIKVKETNQPVDLTSATVKMQWRTKRGVLLKTFETGGNGITILNPPTDGRIRIDQFNCDPESGVHDYDLQYTIGGSVETYLVGEVTIREDITK